MRRILLAAGVAALAIAAPAAAEKGGKGGDKGGQAAKVDRGSGGKAVKAGGRGGDFRVASMRGDRGKKAESSAKVESKSDRREFKSERKVKADRSEEKVAFKGKGRDRDERVEFKGQKVDRDVVALRDWDDNDRWLNGVRRGFDADCPPGLAQKLVPCWPPGQLKNLTGARLPATLQSAFLPASLRDVYRDDDDFYYRYQNGLIYRVDRDRDLIDSLIPLFGGGMLPGQMFPSAYSSHMVPSYYQPFYPETADDYYRYANGYVYEIDRDSGLIEDIIPMYDHGYGVGQMLPASYSYYNVPYPYRSWYPADADQYYRYAPGAIYQVDPTTSLITAVASLLAPGLAVGQPLPMGYSTYNVPLAYRTSYYDTPDNWYRYSNGYIYQVDPTTQLVTAIVRALV